MVKKNDFEKAYESGFFHGAKDNKRLVRSMFACKVDMRWGMVLGRKNPFRFGTDDFASWRKSYESGYNTAIALPK